MTALSWKPKMAPLLPGPGEMQRPWKKLSQLVSLKTESDRLKIMLNRASPRESFNLTFMVSPKNWLLEGNLGAIFAAAMPRGLGLIDRLELLKKPLWKGCSRYWVSTWLTMK